MKPLNVLSINELSVHYRQRAALQAVSLPPIQTGQVVILTGPNGAGKSTLLKALAGLVPAQGEVRLGEVDCLRTSLRERARHIGFMPQELPSDHELNVLEATLVAMHHLALPNQRDREKRVLDILAQLGIEDLALRSLATLSGGQKQLAALAQTIVRGSTVLLLDEPVSALDLAHQWQVMHTVRELANAGHIVLVVLHDLSLSAQWADRIAILNRGRLFAYGAPEEVLTTTTLATVWGVRARIRSCELGQLQVMVDGKIDFSAPAARPGP